MEPTFTPVNDIGEFGLIDRMHAVLGEPEDADVLAGIADDAAVYRVCEGRVHVVTTDALIEGVHFDPMLMPMEHLGFKAVSVNASDVAAMNALPRYATVALGVPNTVSVEMVEGLYQGMKQACARYGMHVIGGDTVAARRLTLSVTVIGEAGEDQVAYRHGARPGDVLCVTGDVGAAYAGLKVLLAQRRALQEQGEDFAPDLDAYRYVIQRQLTPKARVDVVKAWAEAGLRPHALIDISDGVASEVHHLCKQSGCGVLLHAAALPIAFETRDAADDFGEDVDTYALFGGEDYELLFALPPDDLEKLDPQSFNVIGEFVPADAGIRVQTPDGDVVSLDAGGYQHFGSTPDA